jgi:translocation and assembly module TamB
LGPDFALEGRGLNTRLRGQLQITSDGLQAPRASGQVSSTQGQLRAYDQSLNIERGLLRFSGAIDNSTLDILALRPNLTRKVGVQVSDNALLPRISLYADPVFPRQKSWPGWCSAARAAPAAPRPPCCNKQRWR